MITEEEIINRALGKNRILATIRREEPEPHYEVHYDDRVEFMTLDGVRLGVSKVHTVDTDDKKDGLVQ